MTNKNKNHLEQRKRYNYDRRNDYNRRTRN